jgi:hypothetical protein
MALIVEPRQPDPADEIVKVAGAVGGIATQFQNMRTAQLNEARAQRQEGRVQEAHEMDIQTKKANLAHDQNTDRYLGSIQQHAQNQKAAADAGQESGGAFVPDYGAEDFDAGAWNAAQILWMDNQMKNEQFMRQQMQTHAAKAKQQFAGINKEMGNAMAAISGEVKDYGLAFSHIESAYEMHNDGADLVLGKDGKSYKVNLPNGETSEAKFSSPEAMMGDFQQKFAAFSGPEGEENYMKLYMSEQDERRQKNAAGIANAKYYKNDKGDQVQVAYLFDSSGKGANRYLASDAQGNNLGEISEKSFSEGHYKDVTTRKGEAAIAKDTAATEKSRREDKGIKMSTDEKAAHGIARVYGVPIEDAMDQVLNNKALKPKIEIVASLMQTYPSRTNEETGETEFNPKVTAAIKGLGLEDHFSNLSTTPGQGLRRSSKARQVKERQEKIAADRDAQITKHEAGKRGKASGLTTKNTTTAEQNKVKKILADLKAAHPDWTTAKLAEEARKQYSK